MKSYFIKDTTKEEREEIIRNSLGYCDLSCDEGGASLGYDMYQPYIDGKMELAEITSSFRTSYIKEHDIPKDSTNGCTFQK